MGRFPRPSDAELIIKRIKDTPVETLASNSQDDVPETLLFKAMWSLVQCSAHKRHKRAYAPLTAVIHAMLNKPGLCSADYINKPCWWHNSRALVNFEVPPDVLRRLIHLGGDVHFRAGIACRTPLQMACEAGADQAVKVFLDAGADPLNGIDLTTSPVCKDLLVSSAEPVKDALFSLQDKHYVFGVADMVYHILRFIYEPGLLKALRDRAEIALLSQAEPGMKKRKVGEF